MLNDFLIGTYTHLCIDMATTPMAIPPSIPGKHPTKFCEDGVTLYFV